jgi:hypothetical protein
MTGYQDLAQHPTPQILTMLVEQLQDIPITIFIYSRKSSGPHMHSFHLQRRDNPIAGYLQLSCRLAALQKVPN